MLAPPLSYAMENLRQGIMGNGVLEWVSGEVMSSCISWNRGLCRAILFCLPLYLDPPVHRPHFLTGYTNLVQGGSKPLRRSVRGAGEGCSNALTGFNGAMSAG